MTGAHPSEAALGTRPDGQATSSNNNSEEEACDVRVEHEVVGGRFFCRQFGLRECGDFKLEMEEAESLRKKSG